MSFHNLFAWTISYGRYGMILKCFDLNLKIFLTLIALRSFSLFDILTFWLAYVLELFSLSLFCLVLLCPLFSGVSFHNAKFLYCYIFHYLFSFPSLLTFFILSFGNLFLFSLFMKNVKFSSIIYSFTSLLTSYKCWLITCFKFSLCSSAPVHFFYYDLLVCFLAPLIPIICIISFSKRLLRVGWISHLLIACVTGYPFL